MITPEIRAERKRLREERIQGNKEYVAQLKMISRCQDCGSRDELTFDHLPGAKKRGNISNLVYKMSLSTLRAEIAKCEIVCWTCHQARERSRGR